MAICVNGFLNYISHWIKGKMKKGNSFSEKRITIDENKPYTWHQIWNMKDFHSMHLILWYMGAVILQEGGTCLGSSVRNIVKQLCLNIKTFFFSI